MTGTYLAPSDIELRLAEDLRALVVARVEREPHLATVLSDGLRVSEDSVRALMAKNPWDPGLAVTAADVLDLDVRVVSNR